MGKERGIYKWRNYAPLRQCSHPDDEGLDKNDGEK